MSSPPTPPIPPHPPTFQELPFDDLSGIEIQATTLDLVVEGDPELDNVVRLLADSGNGAPTLAMRGSRLVINQDGRYRGSSAPVLKVPAAELPTLAANISRGNLTIEKVNAALAVNLGRGNLTIRGGEGDAAINVSSGDAAIRQREGSIACRITSGNVVIARCQGNIVIDVTKGNADIHDCSGEIGLRVNGGDVAIIRPVEQHLRIASTKGDVRIQGGSLLTADVEITRGDINSSARLLYSEPDTSEPADIDEIPDDDPADFDDIVDEVLDEVMFNFGSVAFTAGESGVRLSTGGTERFAAGPEGIVIRGGDGEPIFVANESGITTGSSGRQGDEQFRFRTGRGNIQVDLAEDQAARVELIVNRGDVHSDLRLVEVGRPGPRSSTRRYVGINDNSDTERILVRAWTNRGDIRMRSTSAPREQPVQQTQRSDRDRQRRQILEALSRGRITADEADILLAAMERD